MLDPYVHGAESLCRHLPKDRPLDGALIGVWMGDDASALLRLLPNLRMLTLIDDWSFRGLPEATRTAYTREQVRDSARQRLSLYHKRCAWLDMPSVDAARLLASAGTLFDFVYLDGDHDEQAVANDIMAWWVLVNPGGILAGHDYGHPEFPGVAQAVKGSALPFEIEGTVWRVTRCQK